MVTSQNTPEPQSILPQSNESQAFLEGLWNAFFSQSIMKPLISIHSMKPIFFLRVSRVAL